MLLLLAGCEADESDEAADAANGEREGETFTIEDVEEAQEAAYDEGFADGEAAAREQMEEEIASQDETEAGDESSDADDADIVVSIVEFYEPDEAEAMIAEANQFNDPPADGFRFAMILVNVENRSDEGLTPWDLNWYAEGPENVVYSDGGCGVMPDPSLSDVVSISPGGNQDGLICFEMREADATATGERNLWVEMWDDRTVDFKDADGDDLEEDSD